MCESMDALFIGRKKAAGSSVRPPLFARQSFTTKKLSTHLSKAVVNRTT